MDETLHRLLAEAVGRYLDAVDQLADEQRGIAGLELRRLAGAWRSVLGLHHPDGARCAGCGRVHLPRPRRGMCAVWRVAGAYFVRRDGGGLMAER
ncbi:hypothetical protein [Alloactinosynnema sp. L-07]|uniref:hypothetical protein n=1 Tax=Alloactinosynnema sp. L-07 TaxID=1653480 RepID=UPI00065F0B92|nr:hypothetical protein [Alloactinosynnema sp. L-07]CRK59912.1 hypothetical protein [Alloactinosynnema sp. L-07]